MVWLSSTRPLTEVRAEDGCNIENVPSDEPICARFSLPYVSYVGATSGCGCGFNSDRWTFGGFTHCAEIEALVDALKPHEREDFESEQRSRAFLRSIVETASAWGPVQVYGVWAGGEADSAKGTTTVTPSWFTEQIAPIAEKYRLDVRARE